MKKVEILKFQIVLPKMLARSGLVGKKSSWPYLGPSEAIFSIGQKNPKFVKILHIFQICLICLIIRFPDLGGAAHVLSHFWY